MKEYKLLKIRDREIGRGDLEQEINILANDGWRVVGCNYIFIALERERSFIREYPTPYGQYPSTRFWHDPREDYPQLDKLFKKLGRQNPRRHKSSRGKR